MVILLGLIFLLGRSTQDQTRKICFIFFRALFHLICIYKVQANFWNYLNRLEKGFNLPGHVSHPESTREGGSRCRLPGHVTLSEGIRRVLSAWALGTRGALGGHPENGSPGWSSRGMWCTRNAPGVSLP